MTSMLTLGVNHNQMRYRKQMAIAAQIAWVDCVVFEQLCEANTAVGSSMFCLRTWLAGWEADGSDPTKLVGFGLEMIQHTKAPVAKSLASQGNMGNMTTTCGTRLEC